jgi:hypothetical protein
MIVTSTTSKKLKKKGVCHFVALPLTINGDCSGGLVDLFWNPA